MNGLRLAVLLDENFERQVISYLVTESHDVEHVVDVLGAGAKDAEDIAPYARSNDRLVVTKDTDFLVMNDSEHEGVLFLDNHRLSAYEIAVGIIRIGEAFSDRDDLRGVEYIDNWV